MKDADVCEICNEPFSFIGWFVSRLKGCKKHPPFEVGGLKKDD